MTECAGGCAPPCFPGRREGNTLGILHCGCLFSEVGSLRGRLKGDQQGQGMSVYQEATDSLLLGCEPQKREPQRGSSERHEPCDGTEQTPSWTLLQTQDDQGPSSSR